MMNILPRLNMNALRKILNSFVMFTLCLHQVLAITDGNADKAGLISKHLKAIAQNELKLGQVKANLDRLDFTVDHFTNEDTLKQNPRFRRKFSDFLRVLSNSASDIRDLLVQPIRHKPNYCCAIESSELFASSEFNTKISLNQTCTPWKDAESFPDLTYVFQKTHSQIPGIRWQYFITSKTHIEYPAYQSGYCGDVSRHRNSYVKAIVPRPKRLIILLDHGAFTSSYLLEIARAAARLLIQSISSQDKVAVIAISGDVSTNDCMKLKPASDEVKQDMIAFIDALRPSKNNTNHTLGFQTAFNILGNSEVDEREKPIIDSLIAFISPGNILLSQKKPLIDLINTARRDLKSLQRVTINSYELEDQKASMLFSKQFLQDVANTFVDPSQNMDRRRGTMFSLNSTDSLVDTVGRFWEVFPPPPRFPGIDYSVPWFDPISHQMMLSVTLPIKHGVRNHVPDGVLGIDIPLSYLTDDLESAPSSEDHYTFLMNIETGHILYHPLFQVSKAIAAETSPPHVSAFEPEFPTFVLVRNDSLRTAVETSDSSIQYIWNTIDDTPFALVAVNKSSHLSSITLTNSVSPKEIQGRNLIYHRGIDLGARIPRCVHSGQLSTTNAMGVFLSSHAFTNPFAYLNSEESPQSVQLISQYLFDLSNLIKRPQNVLKFGIKEEMRTLVALTKEWNINTFNEQIIRKYIASAKGKGVMLMHPPTILPQKLDPSLREWYIRAVELPDRIVVSGPYLDSAGFGNVITISKALTKDRHVIAVLAIDISVGFLHKIIYDLFPECDSRSFGWRDITCFLMDDEGYLLAHPTLADATSSQTSTSAPPIEEKHIAHKEPVVASDILSNKDFAKKKVCVSYSDRSVQRYYKLKLSLANSLKNLISGEQPCAKYQISAVAQTNAFFGMVNHTCEAMRAFLPCAVNDRECINCKRAEQEDSECPCECPIAEEKRCPANYSMPIIYPEKELPLCPMSYRSQQENLLPNLYYPASISETYPSCIETSCNTRLTPSECYESSSCSWCQLTMVGSALDTPYCSVQAHCYRGMVGSRSPYDTLFSSLQQDPGYPLTEFAPDGKILFGPALAIAVVLFVIVVVAKYTCRSANSPHYPREQGAAMPLFHPQSDPDEGQNIQGVIHLHPNISRQATLNLNTYENEVTSVSFPYRYTSPTYLHRATGTESDLGYSSTITPSSELPPAAAAARRATSPESGRASSPSVCSSSMTMILPNAPNQSKKKSGSRITTTAQIHSSDDDGATSGMEEGRYQFSKPMVTLSNEMENISEEKLANTADLIEEMDHDSILPIARVVL